MTLSGVYDVFLWEAAYDAAVHGGDMACFKSGALLGYKTFWNAHWSQGGPPRGHSMVKFSDWIQGTLTKVASVADVIKVYEDAPILDIIGRVMSEGSLTGVTGWYIEEAICQFWYAHRRVMGELYSDAPIPEHGWNETDSQYAAYVGFKFDNTTLGLECLTRVLKLRPTLGTKQSSHLCISEDYLRC